MVGWEDALDEVAQLFGSELIAFQVGHELPVAVNHGSV